MHASLVSWCRIIIFFVDDCLYIYIYIRVLVRPTVLNYAAFLPYSVKRRLTFFSNAFVRWKTCYVTKTSGKCDFIFDEKLWIFVVCKCLTALTTQNWWIFSATFTFWSGINNWEIGNRRTMRMADKWLPYSTYIEQHRVWWIFGC